MTGFTKIDAFCDRAMARMDDLGDEAIQAMRNTPEAKARQAAMRARLSASEKRAADRREAGKTAAVAVANGFSVGQMVRTKLNDRGQAAPAFGTIVAIEGSKVTLDNGRAFVATALVAA